MIICNCLLYFHISIILGTTDVLFYFLRMINLFCFTVKNIIFPLGTLRNKKPLGHEWISLRMLVITNFQINFFFFFWKNVLFFFIINLKEIWLKKIILYKYLLIIFTFLFHIAFNCKDIWNRRILLFFLFLLNEFLICVFTSFAKFVILFNKLFISVFTSLFKFFWLFFVLQKWIIAIFDLKLMKL